MRDRLDDDALAAVMAAAQLLIARFAAAAPPRDTAPRWSLAGRLRTRDAGAIRLAARADSRWKIAGRLGG